MSTSIQRTGGVAGGGDGGGKCAPPAWAVLIKNRQNFMLDAILRFSHAPCLRRSFVPALGARPCSRSHQMAGKPAKRPRAEVDDAPSDMIDIADFDDICRSLQSYDEQRETVSPASAAPSESPSPLPFPSVSRSSSAAATSRSCPSRPSTACTAAIQERRRAS